MSESELGSLVYDISALPGVWSNWFTSSPISVQKDQQLELTLSFGFTPNSLFEGVYFVQMIYFDGQKRILRDEVVASDGIDIPIIIGSTSDQFSTETWSSISIRVMSAANYQVSARLSTEDRHEWLPNDQVKVPGFGEGEEDYDILNSIGEVAPRDEWLVSVEDIFNISMTRGSPLVLDLDGNGIELASLTGTDAVYWDIDQDGFREASGWTRDGDGLLAIDKNADGFISDNGELFGNDANFANGFAALAAYDSNSDGQITAADAAFSSLVVWVDENQNGYSEADELHSLTELGITSISLAYTDTNTTNNGNAIKETSTFVQDGVTRSIVDAWFAYDNVNSTYNGDYTLDMRVLFLPTLRGYGEMADLHIAMSMDNTGAGNLLDMVAALKTQTFDQIFDGTTILKDEVRDILFKWAGVEGVNPRGRGPNTDGQELAFLEKLMGEAFVQRGASSDPYGYEARGDLKEAFTIAFNSFYARLVAQSSGGELFTGDWSYDMLTDTFTGITGLDTTKLLALQVEAAALSTTEDRQIFWGNVVRMVEYSIKTDNLPTASLTALDDAISMSDSLLDLSLIISDITYARPVGVDESGTIGDDTMSGSSGNDTLSGGDGNDTLLGLAGDDKLVGGYGDDILNGDIGNDYLLGGRHNDTYLYNLGDGADTIQDAGNGSIDLQDTIQFGEGITLSDLTFKKLGSNDMLILINEGEAGQIVIENQFYTSPIEQLLFSDSSIYTLTDKFYTTYGTNGDDYVNGVTIGGLTQDVMYLLDGNDTAYGGVSDDIIYGGAGNDSLSGNDGDDTLIGGEGNDALYGGHGNDAYVYESGNDTINDGYSISTSDELRFAEGITLSDLTFSRLNNVDLRIDIAGEGSVTIYNQFNNPRYTIETLRFADDSTLSFSDMDFITYGTGGNDSFSGIWSGGSPKDTVYMGAGNDYIYSGAGNDILYGEDGDDTLSGEDGNDTLIGGSGNDTLYGGAGDDIYVYSTGNDLISEESGGGTNDEILLDEGITSGDLTFSRLVNENFLVIEVVGRGSITIDRQFNKPGWEIETLRFADGSTVNLTQQEYISYGTEGKDNAVSGILSGGQTKDTMYMYGGDDYVLSYAGDDIVYAGSGNDYIRGGAGNDILYGEDGDDTLSGEDGNDTLIGGSGNDTLYGGLDQDTAVYSGEYSYYTITPFSGYIKITDTIGNEGTDTVYNDVEKLKFSDGEYDLASKVFTPFNLAPIANDDVFTTEKGQQFTGFLFRDNGNGIDYDPDGDKLSIDGSYAKITAHGSSVNIDLNTGWFRYTPATTFAGQDSFTYTIKDGKGGTDTATVNVTVNGTPATENSAPIANDDVFATNQGVQFTGFLFRDNGNGIDYDPDGDTLSIDGSYAKITAHGSSVNIDLNTGWFRYTPATTFAGQDSFTYTIKDGKGGTDTATVTVNVIDPANEELHYGITSADQFMLAATDLYDNNIDTIYGFNQAEGDTIDLSSLISGYDPLTDAITDFIEITTVGSNSIIKVDQDGTGTAQSWKQIATIDSITGLTDEQALVNSGTLIV